MTRADVEVLWLSVQDGLLHYRIQRTSEIGSSHPDAVAAQLAGDVKVTHSTSWRWEPGTVVLTYIAVPDPHPVGATPLLAPSIVCSEDPLKPSPAALHAHHVAAHAARHLALLLQSDPTVASAAQDFGAELDALVAATLTIPVGIHAQAHALAASRASGVRGQP